MMDPRLFDYINRAARETGVDPNLLTALAMSESSGQNLGWHQKPFHSGYGFMGLTPGTAQDMRVNYADPYENVLGGARYLVEQGKTYSDPAMQIAAYKMGPGFLKDHQDPSTWTAEGRAGVNNVMRQLGKPLLPESRPAPQANPTTPPPGDANLPVVDWKKPLPTKDGTKNVPVRNPELKKQLEEWGAPAWMSERAGDYEGKGGDGWKGFAEYGLASGLGQKEHYRDAQQDHGQQLTSLMSMLLGDAIGGARSRKRII